MHVLDDKNKCCGCETCSNVCPVHALSMSYDEEGFLHPAIDEAICISCGLCKEHCPVEQPPALNPLKVAYACYAKDNALFQKSSSGGFFAVLASAILKEGGLVSGAAFDQGNMVEHIIIDKEQQLSHLQGTKYVQSRINDSFQVIRDNLEIGKTVLFSGTPCQTAGLKSYLQHDFESLICVDIICHGVPSPMVWKDYLQELSKSGNIQNVVFRKKDIDSGLSSFVYRIDEEEHLVRYNEDLFVKGFIKNLYLRKSCFQCRFKGYERCSDITIGDFWGINEKHSAFANKSGNSIVIVHSKKGQQWFDKIKEDLFVEEADYKEASIFNESLIESVKETELRNAFYSRWGKEPIIKAINDTIAEEKIHTKKQTASVLKKVIKKILHG